jgi:hypothetical protein
MHRPFVRELALWLLGADALQSYMVISFDPTLSGLL